MCDFATNSTLESIFGYLICMITESIIPLLFAVAILGFVYGVVQYFIIGANEEAKRSQGKQFIIWGVIAFAVRVSVWSLVGILGGTFGLGGYTRILPGTGPSGSSSPDSGPNPPVIDLGEYEINVPPIDTRPPCFPSSAPGSCNPDI